MYVSDVWSCKYNQEFLNASFTCLFQEIHILVSLNFLLGTSILFPAITYRLQKSKSDTLIL